MQTADKIFVLYGEVLDSGEPEWSGAVFAHGKLFQQVSSEDAVQRFDQLGSRVIQMGMLPEKVLVKFAEPPLAIEDISAILLPSIPDVSLGNLAIQLDVTGDTPLVLLHAVYEAICRKVEALAMAQLREITKLLPSGNSLHSYFAGYLFQHEMSVPRNEDINTLIEVVAIETPLKQPERIVDPEAWTSLDHHLAEDMLGEGGVFSAALESYEPRQGQQEMSRAVIHAFNARKHLLCEAGTGTGKSLAYLVPSVYWALQNQTPVVVSTNTKNLQSQLYEKDLPLVQRVTGASFRCALIKGRGNYLCLRKFHQLLGNADFALRMGQHALAASIVVWLGETLTGDLSEVCGFESRDARSFVHDITAGSDECSGRSCRFYKPCFVYRARARAMASDVIVANHALVLSEMSEGAQSLPEHAHLILDEAHNLEDAATRYFTVEISRPRIRYLQRRLGRLSLRGKGVGLLPLLARQLDSDSHSALSSKPVEIQKAMDAWNQTHDAFFLSVGALCSEQGVKRLRVEHQNTRSWQELVKSEQSFRSTLSHVVRSLQLLLEVLEDPEEEIPAAVRNLTIDFSAIRAGLQGLQDDLGCIMCCDTPDWVYWAERDTQLHGEGRLMTAPIAVGASLMDQLYTNRESIVFTSATMTVRGQFTYLAGRLGLDQMPEDRIEVINVGTPFQYEDQSSFLVPMFLPDLISGNEQRYADALAALLAKLFKRTGGRGLTLFTSYHMLQRVTSLVREELASAPAGVSVLAQGESFSREYLTETFRSNVASVLMGTHSFWEGVDVPGESLSCVIVARLPFGVFTDPVMEARCEALEASGKSAFRHYSLPQAVIRFRQGFGRLIRHRQDRGVVIVTDKRILSKSYGHWFRSSVPVPAVGIHDEDELIASVEQFLAQC